MRVLLPLSRKSLIVIPFKPFNYIINNLSIKSLKEKILTKKFTYLKCPVEIKNNPSDNTNINSRQEKNYLTLWEFVLKQVPLFQMPFLAYAHNNRA